MDLDIQALLNFRTTGSLVVIRWYDQSGNGNHAIAPNNSQTIIVDGGSLVTIDNNLPAFNMLSSAARFDVVLTNSYVGEDMTTIYIGGIYKGSGTESHMVTGYSSSGNIMSFIGVYNRDDRQGISLQTLSGDVYGGYFLPIYETTNEWISNRVKYALTAKGTNNGYQVYHDDHPPTIRANGGTNTVRVDRLAIGGLFRNLTDSITNSVHAMPQEIIMFFEFVSDEERAFMRQNQEEYWKPNYLSE